MDVENYGDMVQSEKEQAERILNDFLTSAKEIKKICEAHEECSPRCPLYNKHFRGCSLTPYEIDSIGLSPWEWDF